MFKMGLHNPFGHLKHKLGPKEGSRVKLPIWFLTTKSRESPWFPCMQVACDIQLKSSWWGLKLCYRLHFNWRFTCKVMGPQSRRNPSCGNFRLPLRSPETKWHLGVGLVGRQRIYYKGEGGGFPQVWTVVNFVSPSLPATCPNTKNVLTMH